MSSPSCTKCKQPLSTYLFPDDESNRPLGFKCNECKVEWFLKTYVRETHDGNTIKHDNKDYYERLPSLVQKPILRKVKKITDLKIGDQLVWKEFLFEHHAIVSYVQDKWYQVIHFARHNKTSDVKIRQDRYYEINEVQTAIFSLDCKDAPIVIIARALYMFKKKEKIQYNLANFNCESLANYCSTGAVKSFQVDGFPKKAVCTSIPIVASSSHSSSCVVS